MSNLAYTVWAYSASLNQEQRCFTMDRLTPTEAEAHDQADSFARRLNEQRNQHAQDWRARVKSEPVGITSLPNWVSNSITQDPVTAPYPIQQALVDPRQI